LWTRPVVRREGGTSLAARPAGAVVRRRRRLGRDALLTICSQMVRIPRTSQPEPDGIFISHRREENSDLAGRLHDRLADHFGEHKVFMDVDHRAAS
jgi:hypothetical protein